MDILYVYAHNPAEYDQWPALAHSIASVRKFYKNHDDCIYVVTDINSDMIPVMKSFADDHRVVFGQYPQVQGDTRIEVKAQNIITSIAAVIRGYAMQDFIWMCDDFYFVNDVTDADFRDVYHEGTIAETPYNPYSPIAGLIDSTHALLETFDNPLAGCEFYNFMCHHPVVIDGPEFLAMCEKYGNVFQLESLYFNIHRPPPAQLHRRTDDYSVFAWEDTVSRINDKTKFIAHAEMPGREVQRFLMRRIYGN